MTSVFFATSPQVLSPAQQTSWQYELGQAVSSLDELCELLALDPSAFNPAHFPLRVPRPFVAKMQKGNPNDPLLLQVLPSVLESQVVTGYGTDPVGETANNPLKGILHKYRSRVLVTVTAACAVHCRYCFRQHFDYQSNLPTQDDMAAIKTYLRQDDICEILLSGGDPLSVNNRRLAMWLDMATSLPNIQTVRFHTRLPALLPARIDDELLELFARFPKYLVMVLHINHPNEIDDDLAQKCHALKTAGVTLLNQSVLLHRVNDNADTLARLSYALFGVGILPYYLHVLDKVAGAAHFDVTDDQAVSIYWQLLEKVPGYLAPKLVKEEAGKPFKTPINLYAKKTAHL